MMSTMTKLLIQELLRSYNGPGQHNGEIGPI